MKRFWENRWIICGAYGLAAIGFAIQQLLLTRNRSEAARLISQTTYENYVIFKNAFPHLLQGVNIYSSFPAEQWDLFKYSPAFALFMAPFAALPDSLGLPLWNLLNALLPLAALFALPVLSDKQKVFCAWFILPEMFVSLQNSQSNGLTLGMILWTFVALERGQVAKAAAWTAGAAFIKVFGGFAAILALLYPGKGAYTFWGIVWTLFLIFVPLLVVSLEYLPQVYGWWWELLRDDQQASVGLSVQGWLQTWFGFEPPKMAVVFVGIVVFISSVVFAQRNAHMEAAVPPSTVPRLPSTVHRVLAWASLLIWVVIFNHKAESPTFVIAMCGVAMWYSSGRQLFWEKVLLWTTFALASLSPTDIFPRDLREQIVQPYVLKAVPFIIIWGLISYQLIRGSKA